MSRANLFPAALAISAGVITSYYTLQPALAQYQQEQAKKAHQHESTSEKVRDETQVESVTVSDPGSTPKKTWSEKWWTKGTAAAESASPTAGNNEDQRNNQ